MTTSSFFCSKHRKYNILSDVLTCNIDKYMIYLQNHKTSYDFADIRKINNYN